MSAAATLKMMTVDMGADELKPGLSTMFGDNRKEFPTLYTSYMDKKTSTEFYEEYNQAGGFPDVPLLDEGDYINLAKPDLGDRVRLQPERRQLAFAITYLDKKFNKIDKVGRAVKKMARAVKRTTERVAATVFNQGFSATTRPMTDGNPLFSNVGAGGHVRLNGDVVYNRPASDVDLNLASLEDAVVAFAGLTDQDGTPIDVQPSVLMVATANKVNAMRLLQSQNYFGTTGSPPVPNAAYQGVTNIVGNMNLTLVVNPYLTDPDAWFLLGSKDEVEIVLVENEAPTDRAFDDPWTEDSVYSVAFSNIAGAVSDLAVYGSQGG